MSSYYVEGLLCKPAAGCCLVARAERASCRTAPSGEEQTFALAPCLSGVYGVSNGGQSLPVFTSSYQDARAQLCSALEQGRCCHPGPGPLTSPPDKLYPWMRTSGMSNNKVILILISFNYYHYFYKTQTFLWPLVLPLHPSSSLLLLLRGKES